MTASLAEVLHWICGRFCRRERRRSALIARMDEQQRTLSARLQEARDALQETALACDELTAFFVELQQPLDPREDVLHDFLDTAKFRTLPTRIPPVG